jgi:GSCFA family
MRTDGAKAWDNLLANEHSRWDNVAQRFTADLMSIVAVPKFELSVGDRFFCIGSCFVRNIELELIYRDIPVLSKRIICPREEFGHRPTGMVTKYTTASMLNELQWILQPPPAEKVLIATRGGWVDFQLHTVIPVPIKRAIERRRYLTEDYFARLRQTDVLIITLGYVETWLDVSTGLYLNMAPSPVEVRRYPGRFLLERTDVATNLKHLVQIREIVTALSPGCRIVITVSPVPMNATFSGEDVVVANMYSKATLRSAAQAFAEAFSDVEYFPSYELVMLSRREAAFKDDWIHVRDECVERVVDTFISSHFGDVPRRFPAFLDALYLKANPDVEEAIRRGEIDSGYHHWIAHGQAEGRRW